MEDKPEIVGYDAAQHAKLVNSIPAELELKFYNIFRHFEPKSKRIVDVGCGDGIICREAINRGAGYTLGIDSYPDMIDIAVKANTRYEGMINYQKAFIENIKGDESYDIAVLSYLLNNARSPDQLISQCKGVASFLKKGGIAVVFNSNPFDTTGGDFSKYGFRKNVTGTKEGDKIIFDYRPVILEDIVNFYLSPATHEKVFKNAGFSDFKWEPLKLMKDADEDYWLEYFSREHLPVIGMVAIK